jgi:ATP-binding cassette subfamily B protein
MTTLRFMINLTFTTGPRRAVIALVLTTLAAVMTSVAAVLAKLVIDTAVRHQAVSALVLAGVVGLVMLGGSIAAIVSSMIRIRIQEETAYLVDRSLVDAAAHLPTLEEQERGNFLDRIATLKEQHARLGVVPELMLRAFASVLLMGLNLVLLASLHPILLLLPLFAVPTLFAGAMSGKFDQRAHRRVGRGIRLAEQLFGMTTEVAGAKEMRLFGLGASFARTHRTLKDAADRDLDRAQLRGALLAVGGWTVFALGYGAAIVFVVVRAVSGQATAGDVLLIVLLAGQMNAQVAGSVSMLIALLSIAGTVRDYRWLLDQSDGRTAAAADAAAPAEVPSRIRSGLQLENVTFAYPGSERNAVEGIDLDLPAGSIVAVVGENGSGKTTLVKLLARLCEPDAGRILVDGTPLADCSLSGWRSRISAGFQDFARFELTALGTVGVGDLPRSADLGSVRAALARAGAADLESDLVHGMDTRLGQSFDDGVEPSGGQWQRLALGRAMMRETPLLVLLDEPTASLDPEAEHALFERYAGAARAAGRLTGAITVLVSHRFSTVRMADVIIVMSGGRIVEVGPHDTLVRSHGLYAELHELGAVSYR